MLLTVLICQTAAKVYKKAPETPANKTYFDVALESPTAAYGLTTGYIDGLMGIKIETQMGKCNYWYTHAKKQL